MTIAWMQLITIVLSSVLGGVTILWSVSIYYHRKYYVGRRGEAVRWKCQPRRFLSPAQMRETMRMSTINLAIGGVITGLGIYGVLNGWSAPRVYFQVSDYGWWWTLASTLLFFVLTDASAYYAHRFMHTRFMFRHVHRWHHRYVATVPWVVTTMHPLEFVFLQAVTLMWLFVIPLHAVSIVAVLVYALVFNIIDHSGVNLKSRLPWQGPSLYHDDHHKYFHVNFGQHLMLWDRLHGTLRRQSVKYGRNVFGGKGTAQKGGGKLPPFVDYQRIAGKSP